MNDNFFNKKINEQLEILSNDNFFAKSELDKTEYLRQKGFFELEITKRIDFLEKMGFFNLDVNDDPPTIPLTLDKVDYLNKKISSKVKREIAYGSAERFLKNLIKEKKLIIKEIKGMENLKSIETGAILTCNHFNPFDCFTIEEIFRRSGKAKKNKLYKIIKEGNYTNFPGLYGFFFRNCDTLPLASNKSVMKEFMKSTSVILKRGDCILIYPEQSLWMNYKKPKPLQCGAFKIAVKNNVPIIPIFICLEDSNILSEDKAKVQEYTINIEKPIYPDEKMAEKENIEFIKNKNYEVWKNIYEDFYKEPLTYLTQNQEIEAINGRK